MPFRWNIFTNNFDITAEGGDTTGVQTNDILEPNKVVVGDGTNFVKVTNVEIDSNDNLFNVNTLSVIDILTTQQNLELEPGVDVQVWSSILDQFALLNPVPGDIIYADADPKWTKRAIANEGDVLTIRSGFPVWEQVSTRFTEQTINDETKNVTIFTMPSDPEVIIFELRITGLTDTNNLGFGMEIDFAVRTDGVSESPILGTSDSARFIDTQLIDADFEIITIGLDVIIEIKGVAGRTINWTLEATFMRSA